MVPKIFPLAIIVNDVKLVKEMLLSRDFAHRDSSDSAMRKAFNPDLEGIFASMWTPEWKDLRKFTMASLSQLGFGRAAMEDQIVEEADHLIDAMLENRGNAFAPQEYLRAAVSNVIMRLVFGSQARSKIGQESKIHDMLQEIMDGILYLIIHPLYNLWPGFMDYIQTSRLKNILFARSQVGKFIDDAVESHEKSLGAEEEEPRDFIDAVIIARRKRPNDKYLTSSQIQMVILDLFGGGTDTTSAFLNWVIAWILHFPEVKKKLLAEIRETIGMSGSPTIASMSHCNYHLAFFDEVLRCSNVADFTFFHKPTKPVVNFAGHVITDDKLLMGNIWACHNNPDVWDEPHQFKPERHLDSNGKYKRNENVIAFGLGTRRCIGEKLARIEFFVFTVRMLQRLEFAVAPDTPLPKMFGQKPFVRLPENYKLVVSSKKDEQNEN